MYHIDSANVAKMITVLLPPQLLQTCLRTMLPSNQVSQPPTLPRAPLSICPTELPALTPASCPPHGASSIQPWTMQKNRLLKWAGWQTSLSLMENYFSNLDLFSGLVHRTATQVGQSAQARSTPSATPWWAINLQSPQVAASPVPPKCSPCSHGRSQACGKK